MTARRIRPPKQRREITIEHDGKRYPAYEGEPLAAALMASGVTVLGRSSKYHRPRGASCGTGDCGNCLVQVDGMPNRCACTTPCHDEMVSESQNVIGSAENDLLAMTDWMFPRGLDHHEMFTGLPLVQPVAQRIIRKLSGLGVLARTADSSAEREPRPPTIVDVLVVGAGASGLAAAEVAREAGAEVLLVEALNEPGGRRLGGLHCSPSDAKTATRKLLEMGVDIWPDSGAVQIDRTQGVLEVLILRPEGLFPVRPRATVLCCGGYVSTGVFPNNDLPGIMAAEWAARLITKWGMLPGERPVICADEPIAKALRELFVKAGAPPVRVLPISAAYADVWPGNPPEKLVTALGGKHVERVIVENAAGTEVVDCDLVVVASPPAPAFELALDAGAHVAYEEQSGGFAVRAGPEGGTAAENVFAAGTLVGPCTVEEAHAGGRTAGEAAATAALTLLQESYHSRENRDAS